MIKSTPTPWAVKHRQDHRYGVGQGNYTAAICDSILDANLIVYAVNTAAATDDILGALYSCQKFLGAMNDHSGARELLKTVEEALIKAEGNR